MRYEEDEVFPDDLFYSFYYYSWQAVLAYRGALEQVPAEFSKPAAGVLKLLYRRLHRCLKNSMRCTSPRSRQWSAWSIAALGADLTGKATFGK